MIAQIIRWVSIPMLLVGSMFSRFAVSFALPLDIAICLGAIIIVQRAVWAKDYLWAAGFVAVAVVFSPLSLAVRLFLLMGLICIAAFATLFTAWKTHPLPAV